VNRPAWLAVGALGVMAVMTQLALMREMLCAFSGNELGLGIILGNWLLLTGLGSSLGRTSTRLRNPQLVLVLLLFLIALLPPLQIFTLRALRNVIFIRGAAVGLPETVVATFFWLAPFCLASGYLLTLACGVTGNIGGVYVADSLGSIAGGALFTFVLVRRLDHFALLCVPGLMCLLVAGWIRWRWLAGILAVGLIGLLALDVDSFSTALQFPGQRVVFRGQSPYGKLVVTESAGQFNFIENGVPVISTRNIEQVEETVHYALAQRPGARNVLLIGGGVSGTTREILKYRNAQVTYVELDPLIIEAGKRFLPESLTNVRVVNSDGRLFVKQVERASRPFPANTPNGRDARSTIFDVVILDMPAPSTSQLNRYFTSEFFDEVKRVMPRDGVLSFALGRYENFVSPELARLLASAHATLRQTFSNVLMIPGGRVFFVASDGELSGDIAARIVVPTQLVNRHYLDAMLTPDRLADMQRATAAPAALNTDFNPVLYYYHLMHWMSQFRVRYGVWLAVLALGFAAYLVRIRAVPFAIFASGFAASALEVVLLLGFQILAGSVYRQLGVIVTVFMTGLAVGAWMANHYRIRLDLLAAGIAVVAVALPFVLMRLGDAPLAGVTALTFVVALLVGMEFPAATRVETGDVAGTAARLYTADFVGASLGALVASTLLIPLLGVTATCLLTAGLNAGSAAWLWAGAKAGNP
jgi:spermidine synthase